MDFDLDLDRLGFPFGAMPGWNRRYTQSYGDSEIEWDPDGWRETYNRVTERVGQRSQERYLDRLVIAILVRARLDGAMRSPDKVVQSFALAALEFLADDVGPVQEPPRTPTTAPGARVASTMVHGTWGWKGDWWRPRGDFHRFILQNHRPNLYDRGAKFSWSGAYSSKQRAMAATDFVDWAYDVAPHGLQTVFGHSYGGEVAARAVGEGARIHELVLLSSPVTRHVDTAVELGTPTVDVRLPFDPVLAIAGTRQRLAPSANVITVLLKWHLDHGATHDEQVWAAENIASRGRL